LSFDLNLDAGEDPESLRDGREAQLYQYVTRINIACGGHAGDEDSMRTALRLAQSAGLRVGAHPSYPDRAHFGRRVLALTPQAIARFTAEQVTALQNLAAESGMELEHVKPHGALYNQLATDEAIATAFAQGVQAVDRNLILVGLAGSPALAVWKKMGMKAWGESFADRAYRADGSLVPRSEPGAVLTDPTAAASQATRLARDGKVRCVSGEELSLESKTLCVHGDNPAALQVLQAIASIK
jgi:UPF0271 protein